MPEVDNLVIGGGYFGIFAASSAPKAESVIVIDSQEILKGASKFNQARLHSGAHYLRSPQTIRKCQSDLGAFTKDFKSALNESFESIYAFPVYNNLASPETFEYVMESHDIPHKKITSSLLSQLVSPRQFVVPEPSIDHYKMCQILLEKIDSNVSFHENVSNLNLEASSKQVHVSFQSPYGNFEFDVRKRLVLAAYASNPGLIRQLRLSPMNYTTEAARILYAYIPQLQGLGITLVDGPFISVIPWGDTGLHSITSVKYSHSTGQSDASIDNLILNHVQSFLANEIDVYVHERRWMTKIFWNPNPIFDERVTSIHKFKTEVLFDTEIYSINSSKISSLHEVKEVFNVTSN